ncbi:MAG: molybdopterin-guanine dinucleotide biosynthesis protein B [Ezakiella sp.]|nr:molybdopterin-guanine dinucleotide biosynthesis protein B [Ezakiella sp.]
MIKFSVVGYKNTGKTTLCGDLAHLFTNKNYKVGYLKYAHCEIKLDDETDTHRVRQKGASTSIVTSPHGFEIISNNNLSEKIIDFTFDGYDILIIEGNKFSELPKILIYDDEDIPKLKNVIATVGRPLKNLPNFNNNEIEEIGEFILNYFK